MNILALDVDDDLRGMSHASFQSSTSVLDYDIVICDLTRAIYQYSSEPLQSEFQGKRNLADAASFKIRDDITRRRGEFVEFLKLGRTLVLRTPPPIQVYAKTGETSASGTGRNRAVTTIVDLVNLCDAIPVVFSTVQAEGGNISFAGSDLFSAFWRLTKNELTYVAYFAKPIGDPILKIGTTDKIVGAHIRSGKGNVLFLPFPKNQDILSASSALKKARTAFFTSTLELIEEINKEEGDYRLPDWSSAYRLPLEHTRIEEMRRSEEAVAKASRDLIEKQSALLDEQKRKLLFTGTGRSLENAVREALTILGFAVQDGKPGRTDFIAEHPRGLVVLEVKGLTKSAGEKDAAQLEKWVSECIIERSIRPKGILIVNAFRETPLRNRTELAFPDQMIPYARDRQQCLVTTLQLLCMLLQCEREGTSKDELAAELLATTGIVKKYLNWEDYISFEAATEALGQGDPTPEARKH